MFTRTALTGLLAALLMAVLPAVAAATITPSLTLNQSAGTTAGSSPPTGLEINFSPFAGDSARNLVIALPAGFMLNLEVDGGACLTTAAPSPSCRIGSGTINGGAGTPVALYLVAPLKLSDVAGVALVEENGTTRKADVELETAPALSLTLSFYDLPPGIERLALTLENTRLPTSCQEQDVEIEAASWEGSQATASAPLKVTGCSSLPYAPKLTTTLSKVSDEEATMTVAITQSASESATSALAFGLPTETKLSRFLLPCLEGNKCTIGFVSATSPLLPSSALADGPMVLTGSVSGAALNAPLAGVSLTSTFPSPYPFVLTGPINLTERMITFPNLPDLPLSTLTFDFTGVPQEPPFTIPCVAATIESRLTPEDGNPIDVMSTAVTNVNCPPILARPTGSGSVSGLASRAPAVRFHASRTDGGPDIAALSIALPTGLSFNREALSQRRVCTGGHSCKRSVTIHGLSLTGAAIASASISPHRLVIAFTRATASVSLSARAPLVAESEALVRKAMSRQTGKLTVRVHIADTTGATASVNVR